jgi:cob(I)alamin adenosyltransferase
MRSTFPPFTNWVDQDVMQRTAPLLGKGWRCRRVHRTATVARDGTIHARSQHCRSPNLAFLYTVTRFRSTFESMLPSSHRRINDHMDMEDLHRAACQMGSTTYIDPVTGFTCFTEVAHLKRGVCCGSQCRHCPYGWQNVSAPLSERRVAKVKSGDRAAISMLLQRIQDAPKSTNCSNGEHAHSRETECMVSQHPTTTCNGTAETKQSAASTLHKQTNKTGGRHGGRHTSKNVPYTRSGDAGTAALLTGERRRKDEAAFDAMGTVDELCSVTGVCYATIAELIRSQAHVPPPSQETTPTGIMQTATNDDDVATPAQQGVDLELLNEWLLEIMSRLFDIGSHVAKPPRRTPPDNDNNEEQNSSSDAEPTFEADGVGGGFHARHVTELEDWIDVLTDELPELLSFVLPTGHVAAAQLHVARTVCRRAERSLVPLVVTEHGVCDPNALHYLNRLSDFYFTAARYINYNQGFPEILYRRPERSATQRQRQVKSTDSSLPTAPP